MTKQNLIEFENVNVILNTCFRFEFMWLGHVYDLLLIMLCGGAWFGVSDLTELFCGRVCNVFFNLNILGFHLWILINTKGDSNSFLQNIVGKGVEYKKSPNKGRKLPKTVKFFKSQWEKFKNPIKLIQLKTQFGSHKSHNGSTNIKKMQIMYKTQFQRIPFDLYSFTKLLLFPSFLI